MDTSREDGVEAGRRGALETEELIRVRNAENSNVCASSVGLRAAVSTHVVEGLGGQAALRHLPVVCQCTRQSSQASEGMLEACTQDLEMKQWQFAMRSVLEGWRSVKRRDDSRAPILMIREMGTQELIWG